MYLAKLKGYSHRRDASAARRNPIATRANKDSARATQRDATITNLILTEVTRRNNFCTHLSNKAGRRGAANAASKGVYVFFYCLWLTAFLRQRQCVYTFFI